MLWQKVNLLTPYSLVFENMLMIVLNQKGLSGIHISQKGDVKAVLGIESSSKDM